MKKITTLFAAAVMAVSASAQTVAESKTFDNVYVGINAGVATKTTGHASWLEDFVPNVGLRIGRNFNQSSVWLQRATSTSRRQAATQQVRS